MSIKEIAEKAGVSVSTVSRVLSKPEYKCSSKELREKIFAAAREMNYVPIETITHLEKNTHFFTNNSAAIAPLSCHGPG